MTSKSSLRFGTAGVPHSTRRRSSADGIAQVKHLGLDAMELEFVHRATMGADTAQQVRQVAAACDVRLSSHAPYYLNLNSKDPEKLAASRTRLLNTIRISAACGARNVVFHPAFYHRDAPSVVYLQVRAELERIAEWVREEQLDVRLCPETMGRESQFGSLEETLQLCAEIEGVRPCLDMAHLYARSRGRVNSLEEFRRVFECVVQYLGPEGLQDMHIHAEGILFGERGERKHANLRETAFNYRELLQALIATGATGTIICESPNLEEDATLLQQTYRELLAESERHLLVLNH